jgi:peptide deformylase
MRREKMKLVNKNLVENCKCEKVDLSEIREIEKIADKMFKLMFDNNGIGLAAPQVGIFKRFFIIKNFQGDGYELIINPEIIWKSNKLSQSREGCLTYNNGLVKPSWVVKRPKSIIAKYYEGAGHYAEKRISKLTAQVFQHEYDHLEGITIFNKIG